MESGSGFSSELNLADLLVQKHRKQNIEYKKPGREQERVWIIDPKEQERFTEAEEERLKNGSPELSKLALPTRYYNALRRAGIKTVDGIEERLKLGIPWGINEGGIANITKELASYRSANNPAK